VPGPKEKAVRPSRDAGSLTASLPAPPAAQATYEEIQDARNYLAEEHKARRRTRQR